MKKIFLLALLLCASRAEATVSLVQSTSSFSGAASSIAKAYTSNVTNANFLLVKCDVWNTSTATTISDSQSATWTQIDTTTANGAAVNHLEWFFRFASSTVALTVTCNTGAASGLNIYLEEWANVSNVGTIDAHATTGASVACASFSVGPITVAGNSFSATWTVAGGAGDNCGALIVGIKGTGGDHKLLTSMFDVTAHRTFTVSAGWNIDLDLNNTTVGMGGAMASLTQAVIKGNAPYIY